MCSMIEFHVFACSINIYFIIYNYILAVKLYTIMNKYGDYGEEVAFHARQEAEFKARTVRTTFRCPNIMYK